MVGKSLLSPAHEGVAQISTRFASLPLVLYSPAPLFPLPIATPRSVQAAIPISMVISKRLMGTRYAITQYIGATVVAMGIVVAIGPSLAVGSSKRSEVQELIWSFVLVLSCVPMALSSVYKELALGESELDPIYLNG